MKSSLLSLLLSCIAVTSAFAQSKIVVTFEGQAPEKYTLIAANSGKPNSSGTFKVREATTTKMFTFNPIDDFDIIHFLTEEGSFKIFLGANDELLFNIIELDSVTFAGGSAKDSPDCDRGGACASPATGGRDACVRQDRARRAARSDRGIRPLRPGRRPGAGGGDAQGAHGRVSPA